MKTIRTTVLIISLCIITSCTTDGVGRYRIQSIGNAYRSVEAIILQTSSVYIQEGVSGAGAALGGTIGGGIAAENSDNLAVIIAGIISGALVGEYMAGLNNIHTATEYVIQTSNGALFTVAQVNDGNEIFTEGTSVILIYGYPIRLIRDVRK